MLCKMCVFLLGICALVKGHPLQKNFEEADDEKMEETSPIHPESYVLPLSYDADAPLLVVPVPQSFQLANNGSSYPDVLFLEFVPQTQNMNYWSELITIGQSSEILDAHAFIKTFKMGLEELQLLDSYPNYTSYIRCGLERGIKVGYYISEHPSINPRQLGIHAPQYNEMLKVKTVQGEDRVWVIQYAIRYNAKIISDEQREKILDKIQTFFKSCKISSNVTPSSI